MMFEFWILIIWTVSKPELHPYGMHVYYPTEEQCIKDGEWEAKRDKSLGFDTNFVCEDFLGPILSPDELKK